jgi:serine/threonine protein phosphatase PrpC
MDITDPYNPKKKGKRYILADGAGGSSTPETSGKVTQKMRHFIDKAIRANKTLQEATFDAANFITDSVNEQQLDIYGYGTFVGADILEDRIDMCWKGDPAALLWKSGKPFQHRRSKYSGRNGATGNLQKQSEPSQFQLQSYVQNLANRIHMGGATGSKTMMLDTDPNANQIYSSIGDKKLKNKESVPQFTLTKEEIVSSGAEFLILACDGVQPNTMIDMSNAQNINPYNTEIDRIMTNLHLGNINTAEAAQQITQASRNINQDADDITVMVVDLRQWKSSQ